MPTSAAFLGICFALTACSNGPAESDLKSAIRNKMKTDFEAMVRSSAAQAMPVRPEIKNVRKLGCKEDGANTYRCEVELDVLHNGVAAKGSASMLFSKGDAGWVASN